MRQGWIDEVVPGQSMTVYSLSESLTSEFNEFTDFMRKPDPERHVNFPESLECQRDSPWPLKLTD